MASNTTSQDCQLLSSAIFSSLNYKGPGQCCDNNIVVCDKSNSITKLYLNSSQLTGTIPPQISQLSNLVHLNVSDNPLSSSNLPDLTSLKSLQILDAFSAGLSGKFPSWISNVPSLAFINLSSNKLRGSIPDLGSLSNLFYFNAGNNKLAGTIPDFSSFSKLQYLLLHGNNFEQDSFPKWIFQMSNLIELYLDSSYMPGPIFPGISKLVGLQVLSLSYCNVTGNITLDIQYLKNLQTLYLDHNQLTGPIPQEISLIADLSYLDLSNNELDPTVPLAIKQMKNYDPNNFLFANQSVPPVSTGVPPVSASGGGGSMYIIIAVVVVVILGIAGAGFYLYSLKMKKTKSNAQKDSYNQGQPQIVNQPQSPPFNQVQPQPFIQTPPQMFAQQQPPELNRGTAFDQPYSTPQGHPNQYIQSAQYHPAQMQVYSNGQVEQTLQQQYPNAQFLGAQDSPLTEKYSPQRHSPGSSPEQTLVVTNTSYQSVNLNSPYSNHQSLSTSKAELPVLSAVQSPFADLLLQPDHLQPPVLARNDSNGPVSKKEEIEIDSQPPLLF